VVGVLSSPLDLPGGAGGKTPVCLPNIAPRVYSTCPRRREEVMTTDMDIWTYRAQPSARLTGYEVEATDGSIGKVDDSGDEPGDSYLVVDTGPWIFGKRVLLPAGLVGAIDTASGTVHVDATKEQVQGAPEYDIDASEEAEYRRRLARYYERTVADAAG
jgi:hypothetical protein